MRLLTLCLFVLLLGCKTTPTSVILTDNVVSELGSITQQIQGLENGLTTSCKQEVKDSFIVINNRLDSVSNQVKTINTSCIAEKNVLIQRMNYARTVSLFIICILGFIILLLLRKKI